jgi:hypothetical protein
MVLVLCLELWIMLKKKDSVPMETCSKNLIQLFSFPLVVVDIGLMLVVFSIMMQKTSSSGLMKKIR